MSLIEIEREDHVADLWLSRPEQHNALSGALMAELVEALRGLAADDSVRVAVLGGRGPSFCAGADLADMKASTIATFEQNLADAERLAGLFAALADFPKPLVGRIHGSVFGGGVGLTCACDIAVASEDARFGLTESRLGIIPGVISPYVIRRLGDRHARELMLTGERFGAEVALRVGLVHYVTPPLGLDARVDERVGELLKAAPGAQRRIKALLARYADTPWSEYRAAMPRVLAEIRSGDEAHDGITAFFEKRKPRWMS